MSHTPRGPGLSCQDPHKYPSMVHVLLWTPHWLGPPRPRIRTWGGFGRWRPRELIDAVHRGAGGQSPQQRSCRLNRRSACSSEACREGQVQLIPLRVVLLGLFHPPVAEGPGVSEFGQWEDALRAPGVGLEDGAEPVLAR
ncbi:unnamed protein product [Rangifer tarandus platyrhynchus]|uniref:Uncharacterized protein n=1 Tax=Rangifer tarandus platyrhynchus TaxID=3082113 RepID=A0AC59YDX9_RANTA